MSTCINEGKQASKQNVLKFANNIHRAGLNVTVRNDDEMRLNTPYHLWLEDGRRIVVIQTCYRHLNEIRSYWLRWHHDPDCQTYDGLKKNLKKYYPDMKENPLMRVIFYVLEEE
jgi:hypothetical protein